MKFDSKFFTSLTVSLMSALTLFFFTPSNIFFANAGEFNFSYMNVVFSLLLLSLTASCALGFILYFLKNDIYQRAVSIIIAFGLLMWFQGNILLWDYGLLDGRDINWSDYTKNGIIDLAIWGIVIILSLVKYKTVVRHARIIVIFIILTQMINLTYTIFDSYKKDPPNKTFINDSKKYLFSDKQNVIILVLDTFSTVDLINTFKENPHLTDIFDGFYWYRNNVGGYHITGPSMHFLLTGIYYDNSITIKEYKKKVYLESSLPSILKKAGYNTEIYSFAPRNFYLDTRVASNFIKKTERIPTFKLNLFFENLCWPALFKVSPHHLKKFFYRLDTDIDYYFIKNFVSKAQVRNIPKTFKLYHLWGMHFPFTFYKKYGDTEYVKKSKFSSIRTHQATALLAGVDEFLKKLKSLGIYDDSIVIVVGDHGQYPLLPDVGTPILLMKKLNSKGKLTVSDIPTTSGDVPKTVLDYLNIANVNPGINIFKQKENLYRERIMFYPNDLKILHPGYLPALTKYQVIGKSYELSSYINSSIVYDFNPVRPIVKTGKNN